MTKRFFYSDRITAAWMLRHGLRFMPDCWTHQSMASAIEILNFRHHAFKGKFYIHPDSLHLLNAQAGDLIVATDDEHRGITLRWDSLWSARLDWQQRPHDAKIIMRNGTLFMWPECES